MESYEPVLFKTFLK